MTSPRGDVLAALALVVVVLGAGCLGGGQATPTAAPEQSAAPSPTPTATPTPTGTPEPTPEPVQYPAGFDETGYDNRSAAIQGHIDALEDRSFTSTTTLDFDSKNVTITIEANPESGTVSKVRRTDDERTGAFYFADGAVVDDYGFRGGEMDYREAMTFQGQFEEVFWAELSDPVFDRSGDRTLITYDVAGISNGSLTVSENGIIVSYRVVTDSGTLIEYEVSRLGLTTVEKP